MIRAAGVWEKEAGVGRWEQGIPMYDLVAEGPTPGDRWRKKVPEGVRLTVGRQSPPWDTPWDSQISRRHVELFLRGDRLEVERLASAANPVFYQGSGRDRFELGPNEKFVIGRTTFLLVPNQAMATQAVPQPIHMVSFSDDYLRQVNYRDVRGRLEILGELPSLIAGAGSNVQLHDTLARLVLRGVLRAQTVSIVSMAEPPGGRIDVVHWDTRKELTGGFQPSERLIRQAIASQQTVLHIWRETSASETLYTMQQNSDWAFVCPLTGTSTRGQALYISGQSLAPDALEKDGQLQDDMKFVQVVGATYSSLRDLRQLEQRQSSLRGFFSPIVVDALANQDIELVLEPRECELSILFCDLRGFSGTSERMSGNLLQLLERVSRALGVMTRNILDHRGVVGDFHGDAVMGFWGWPMQQADAGLRAARTALDIASQFRTLRLEEAAPTGAGIALEAATKTERGHGSPPGAGWEQDFMMGLGIASGTAVAGKIGSADQVKVTAFGPVVNLAARLESLTRQFRVPILCDEPTAKTLQREGPESGYRVRQLCRMLPSGFARSVAVWQILPDAAPYNLLDSAVLQHWDEIMGLVSAGRWREAMAGLEDHPAIDRPREFVMEYIRSQNLVPPADWAGSIPQRNK